MITIRTKMLSEFLDASTGEIQCPATIEEENGKTIIKILADNGKQNFESSSQQNNKTVTLEKVIVTKNTQNNIITMLDVESDISVVISIKEIKDFIDDKIEVTKQIQFKYSNIEGIIEKAKDDVVTIKYNNRAITEVPINILKNHCNSNKEREVKSSIVTNITIKPVDNNQNLSITQNEIEIKIPIIKMNMLIYGGFEAVSFTYGDKTTAVTTEELEKLITKAKETPPKTSVTGVSPEGEALLAA